MDDNEYRYHVYPHYGCLNDWFIAYNELAEAVVKYLKIEETTDQRQMPFKDGRMTPAEKRAMEKRYGVKEGTYRRSGANYMNEDTPDTFKDRLTKAAANDYDTRKAQETLHLALTDEDYRKSLGKKAQNFVNDYESSDKKDKDGMLGISNFKELQAVNDFGKIYHKHERNLGGNYSSANDYGGGSMDMMDSMRKHYDRNFVTQDELPKPEETQAPKVKEDKKVVLSPEHQAAQDRLSEYTNNIMSGKISDTIYGAESDNTKPQNLANDNADSVYQRNESSDINVDSFSKQSRDASRMFLDKFKSKLVGNFEPEFS